MFASGSAWAQCVPDAATVTCDSAEGIYPGGIALSSPGDLNVVILPGVLVQSEAAGTGGLVVRADGAVSVAAASDVTILSVGAGEVAGDAPGVSVVSGGAAGIALDRVTTIAPRSPGIGVTAGAGITLSANAVETIGEGSDGVMMTAAGPIVFNLGEVTTRGPGSTGVMATTSGSISGTIGMLLQEGGSIEIDNGPDVPPTRQGGVGIDLSSTGSDVALTLGTVTSRGNEPAIRVAAPGGSIRVAVTGAVEAGSTVLDLAAPTILSVDTDGDRRTPPVTTPIPGSGDPALRGVVTVDVAAGGSIKTFGRPAIRIDAGTSSRVTNAGMIEHDWAGAWVLQASGGPITIVNTGTIRGGFGLTGGADTVTNAGTLVFAGAASFDGAGPVATANLGIDTFVNSGTVALFKPEGTNDTMSADFRDLEQFDNAGLIDMRTGVAGDFMRVTRTYVPTSPGSTVIPQAVYRATGAATIAVDLEFRDNDARIDRLILEHATGKSRLIVNVVGDAEPNLLVGRAVIDVANGSDATFVMDPLQVGDIRYALIYNPTLGAFALYGAAPATLMPLTKLPGNVQAMWYGTGDIVSSHLRQERDRRWTDAAPGGRLWFQLSGETVARNEIYDATINYVPVSGLDLGQRQNTFLGQAGIETAGPENGRNGIVLGATAGYGTSTARFRRTSDRFAIDQLNLGVYASWLAGPFYVTGTGNVARHAIEITRSSSRIVANRPAAKSIGAAIEAGLRLGSDSFFVEPSAGFTYVVTKVDDIALRKGAFTFDEFTGNQGMAGLRVGGQVDWGDRQLVYYASAKAIHEYGGNDYAAVMIGAPPVDIPVRPPGTIAKATAGINLIAAGKANLFAESNAYLGKAYRGGGGRVGVRIGL